MWIAVWKLIETMIRSHFLLSFLLRYHGVHQRPPRGFGSIWHSRSRFCVKRGTKFLNTFAFLLAVRLMENYLLLQIIFDWHSRKEEEKLCLLAKVWLTVKHWRVGVEWSVVEVLKSSANLNTWPSICFGALQKLLNVPFNSVFDQQMT